MESSHSSSQPPGSPDLLDSPGPASPIANWDPTHPFPGQGDSETFTQRHEEDSNDSVSTINYEANPVGLITNEDSNTVNSERLNLNEDSNTVNSVGFNINEDSSTVNSVHNPLVQNVVNIMDEDTILPPNSAITVRNDDESDSNISEPPAKIRKLDLSPKMEEQDGETCPICLDTWGNSGDHRLVALKCGHLFGSKCVERWLKAQVAKERSCPTCKAKSSIRDIRFIYARRLVTADTAEITALQKQVEILQSEKIKVELELQKTKIAHRACSQQLQNLVESLAAKHNVERPTNNGWRFALEKNLEVNKDGGCRVMSYNCRTYELYISQKSVNSLFPGYGFRRVSCIDYKLGQFVHLHPKPIRDMTYSQPKDLLLSVSLDNTARLVERGIPSLTIPCGVSLWSCAWNALRDEEFYLGGAGGTIYHYDVRNTSAPIQNLVVPSDKSPVISICSTEFGLLSCQLNSSWLWVPTGTGCEPRALPVDGPFMSMCYDTVTQRNLLSCRPVGSERSRLVVCKLTPGMNGEASCEIVKTLAGSAKSSLMSRAAWVTAPGSKWVAAHSESESTLYLHGLDGARSMSLPATEPALDVTSLNINNDVILTALSDTRVRIYKAVAVNSR